MLARLVRPYRCRRCGKGSRLMRHYHRHYLRSHRGRRGPGR